MLPQETRLALFPRRRLRLRIGIFRSVVLYPLTGARAAAMEVLGCGLLDGVPIGGKALLAAWVLSLRDRDVARAVEDDADGAQRFILRLKGSTALIEEAVRVLTAEAAVTLIPPKPTEEEQNLVDDGIPRGLGWPLEVVESLCANYKMPFEDAMRCEVQRAFALIATCRARCGGEHGGPDYYDRIRMVRWRKDGIIRSAAKGGGDGGKQ